MSDQKCLEEYIRRIHKVQDYMEQHLGKALTVDELAYVAGFSKFHFSRIFQGILHESLGHYVNRLRMEKALFLLAHRKDKNMTDIAYELGFTESAIFSRAFKHYYGVSPKEYRMLYSKNCKEPFLLSKYNKDAASKEGEKSQLSVGCHLTIETIPEKQTVYARHTGTYETLAKAYPQMLESLMGYAQKAHIQLSAENWLLAIYHDNPEFGEEEQFHTSLCLTVPEQAVIEEDNSLGRMKLAGGLYAVGHFKLHQEAYRAAWEYMYQVWIMQSGYMPRNSTPFEVYRNNPAADAEHLHEVDIYVPIEPIRY